MTLLTGGAAVIGNADFSLSEGSRKYRIPISRAMGSRDIMQTVSIYSHGLAPARRNPTAEEVLYVVRGQGSCFIDGHIYELDRGTAVYVPPGSVSQIRGSVDELEIVSVCCPEDLESQVVTEDLSHDLGDTKPFRTVLEERQKSIPTGDRTFKLLVGRELGAERVTQFVGVIPPGKAPMHHHTYEEAIYIVEGSGTLWTEDGGAEFGAGDSVYLPRGVSHCLENTGTSNIKLLGVFHPSGSPANRYDD
jgi:mannose-6-phosphate isomerase-like protein (cupin superfamily)